MSFCQPDDASQPGFFELASPKTGEKVKLKGTHEGMLLQVSNVLRVNRFLADYKQTKAVVEPQPDWVPKKLKESQIRCGSAAHPTSAAHPSGSSIFLKNRTCRPRDAPMMDVGGCAGSALPSSRRCRGAGRPSPSRPSRRWRRRRRAPERCARQALTASPPAAAARDVCHPPGGLPTGWLGCSMPSACVGPATRDGVVLCAKEKRQKRMEEVREKKWKRFMAKYEKDMHQRRLNAKEATRRGAEADRAKMQSPMRNRRNLLGEL